MNYRKFGNTGEKISALGFGCMRFPEYEKDGKMYVDQDKVDEMVAGHFIHCIGRRVWSSFVCTLDF